MRNTQLLLRNGASLLAVATFLWVSPPAIAQSPSSSPPAQQADDSRRAELASFDQFLDGHRQILEELRGDPSRIRNSEFLEKYPELQTYLQNHPAVQQDLTANPNGFMLALERHDWREQFGPGSTKRDPDVTRRELASFDRFLDSHRQISEELRGDPSRIRDNQFLQKYPELVSYLQTHPEVREELHENPNSFLWAENVGDFREQHGNQANNRTDIDSRSDNDRGEDRDIDSRDRDRDRNFDREDRDSDARRSNMRGDRDRDDFDRFLNSHREIGEQVRKNPSLLRDKQFIETHAALQVFLQEHASLQAQANANPNALVASDERFEQRSSAQAQAQGQGQARTQTQTTQTQQTTNDHDTTHGQIVSFDQFLDHHREIAEQLRKDPSLVNNQKWVQNHPALQQYLQAHQGVREEITENPSAFMTAENNYDRRDDRFSTDRNMSRGQMKHGDLDSFRGFLSSHSTISQQLSKDPALAKDPQFLQAHPEFREFLSAHPGVQTALTQNPHSFMKTATETGTSATTGTTAKPSATEPAKPPKP